MALYSYGLIVMAYVVMACIELWPYEVMAYTFTASAVMALYSYGPI